MRIKGRYMIAAGLVAVCVALASLRSVAAAPEYAYCIALQHHDDSGIQEWLVDGRTGAILKTRPYVDREAPYVPDPDYATYESPDRRHILQWKASGGGRYRLELRDKQTGNVQILERTYQIADYRENIYLESTFWSPDSSRAVYWWQSAITGKVTLGIVNTDGSNQQRIELPAQGSYNVDWFTSSNDSQFVALVLHSDMDSWLYLWNTTKPDALVSYREPDLYWVDWSPRGGWLAYEAGRTLTLVSALDGTRYTFADAPYINPYWGDYAPMWSPDGRYLAVPHVTTGTNSPFAFMELSIYGVDGRSFPKFTSSAFAYYSQRPTWSENGPALVYYSTDESSGIYDYGILMAFYPNTGQNKAVSRWLDAIPAMQQDVGKQLLVLRQGIYKQIFLTDIDGSNPRTLVDNASDVGEPVSSWRPIGLAFVWYTGTDTVKQAHLGWFSGDFRQFYRMDEDFTEIDGIQFVDDLSHLAYRAKRDGRWQADYLDMRTGQRRTLAQNMSAISLIAPYIDGYNFGFTWQSPEGRSGIEAYTPDGGLRYRFSIPGNAEVSERSFAILSPDSSRAVLGFARYVDIDYVFDVYMADASGSLSRKLWEGISRLSVDWSPDGQGVFIVHHVDKPEGLRFVLTLFNRSGTQIRELSDLDYAWQYSESSPHWVLCEPPMPDPY